MVISNIHDVARKFPGKTAIVYNGCPLSYVQFSRCIDVCREYFSEQDLPPSAVAVIDAHNRLDAWIFSLALRSLGLTTLAVGEVEDVDLMRVRNIGCVVSSVAENRPAPRQGSPTASLRRIRVPSELRLAVIGKKATGSSQTRQYPGGHIMMTSGTTGRYKMVVRDAAVEALAIPLHADINGITDQSVVHVGSIGLWTAGGYRWPLITWSVGGTVVMNHGEPLLLDDLTHLFTTPGSLASLLRASDGKLRRNDGMRLLVTGGNLSRVTLATAKQYLTHRVYSVLASTEALTVAITPLERPEDLQWHRIHPSRKVQIVDDADNVLGPGEEGLVRIRIIDGLKGYLNDEAATRQFFRHGYFYPGDLGVLGRDGRLALLGRASDVLNILGDKIAAAPIEQSLQDRLGVDTVCVLCIENTGGTDEAYVVIQATKPVNNMEVAAALDVERSPLKRLRVNVVFMDALPRNEMGKVERLVLKRQLLGARDGKRYQI